MIALAALLLACASPDVCGDMCAAAQTRFESCLTESGLEYGSSVGYTDAADYAGWCSTYVWELRELGEAEACAERLPVFEEGTCDDYYDAWERE